MKHYEEIANRVLERRDEYVARQKQKRQTVMRITSVTCAFALVALVGFGVWQAGGQNADPAVENTGTSTTLPVEQDVLKNPDGLGGLDEGCPVHNEYYHAISGNFDREKLTGYVEYYKSKEVPVGECDDPCNIVDFVKWAGITREELMKAKGWSEEELDEQVDYETSYGKAPYTKRQWLDAVLGDNPELSAWVFADESTWPED